MPYMATMDRVAIYYEDKGEGKPVVLIHGWSGSRIQYAFSTPVLSSKFRVITYDHRGHGASEKPEHGLTMKRLAMDLEELLAHLDLRDVVIVGWSMGAQVLFEYVKNFGCGRLDKTVIIDMTPKLINDENWNLGLYHGDFDHEDNLHALSTMCHDWEDYAEMFIKKAAPKLTAEEFRLAFKESRKNIPHIMYAFWIAMAAADYREELNKITVPSLILYGKESTLYTPETAEYIFNAIPESKKVEFENCGHMLVLEDPERFNKVIEEFVQK